MTERDRISIPNTPTIILSGGEGQRLRSITQDIIPKALVEIFPGITFIDQLLYGLMNAGFEHYIFCLGFGSKQIIDHLCKKWPQVYRMSQFSIEDKPKGTAGAISQTVHKLNITSPFFVITSDALFPYDNIHLIFDNYKKGSFAWAITKTVFPEIADHYCMLVDKNTKAIIGNTRSKWTNDIRLDEIKQKNIQIDTYLDGGHGLIDPSIFLYEISILGSLCKSKEKICLYKDLLPMMAEQNRRKLMRKQSPTFYSVDVMGAIIDMGTPERLKLARDCLQKPSLLS